MSNRPDNALAYDELDLNLVEVWNENICEGYIVTDSDCICNLD